jgi:acid phosphatase
VRECYYLESRRLAIMTTQRREARWAVLLFCLCLAACSSLNGPGVSAPLAANVQERLLYADLYMQTAAEYEAVCLQTYNWAGERLKAKLAGLPKDGPPPAVVMDLDETVFDNGGYHSFLHREGLTASASLWDIWERDFPGEVGLVPGAKPFIEAAERTGVPVVYISNRQERFRNSTIAALAHLGLSLDDIDQRLMLLDTTSDKTERRKQAETMFRVLMYVGDNLRDFSDEFAVPPRFATDSERLQALAGRKENVRRAGPRWGDDWIILPNPVYGEWTKLLGPEPVKFLRPTKMKK